MLRRRKCRKSCILLLASIVPTANLQVKAFYEFRWLGASFSSATFPTLGATSCSCSSVSTLRAMVARVTLVTEVALVTLVAEGVLVIMVAPVTMMAMMPLAVRIAVEAGRRKRLT